MVTNVTSLLKTVKAVEDEATRGTRALEATIECIKQELTVRTDAASGRSAQKTSTRLNPVVRADPPCRHREPVGSRMFGLLSSELAKPGSHPGF